MGVRLNRLLGASAGLEAGMWCRESDEFVIACPICAAILKLDDRHVVNPAGNVTPALSCHRCPFLDWVELGSIE